MAKKLKAEKELEAEASEEVTAPEDSGLTNVFAEKAAAQKIEDASDKKCVGHHPITKEPVYI